MGNYDLYLYFLLMSQTEMVWFICMYSFVSVGMCHVQRDSYERKSSPGIAEILLDVYPTNRSLLILRGVVFVRLLCILSAAGHKLVHVT